jgi:hypothetical protein
VDGSTRSAVSEGFDMESELTRNPSMKRAFSSFTKSDHYLKWQQDYNGINWEDEVARNPNLAAALGSSRILQNIAPTFGGSYANCHFMFQIGCGTPLPTALTSAPLCDLKQDAA